MITNRYKTKILPVFFVLLAFSGVLSAETFHGKCVSVSDGDTIGVMRNGKKIRVRLDCIDAPEKCQACGTKAKQFTSELVFGKVVTVEVKGHDKYGKTIGRVFVNRKDINLELVKNGYAWHYKRYSPDPAFAKAEAEAKSNKRGLWALPNPIPPWEFRHGKKYKSEATYGRKGY